MENCAYNHFSRHYQEVYYYKTNSNQEVDFVLKQGQNIEALVQICVDLQNEETKKRELKALTDAGEELKCRKLIVATLDYEGQEAVSGNVIQFIPLYKLILSD